MNYLAEWNRQITEMVHAGMSRTEASKQLAKQAPALRELMLREVNANPNRQGLPWGSGSTQADLIAQYRSESAIMGNKPPSTASPTIRWNAAVREQLDKGLPRAQAVSMANKVNPGLREQMLQEVNQ